MARDAKSVAELPGRAGAGAVEIGAVEGKALAARRGVPLTFV